MFQIDMFFLAEIIQTEMKVSQVVLLFIPISFGKKKIVVNVPLTDFTTTLYQNLLILQGKKIGNG